MASREHALITAEEYARMPDDGIPTELVRGRIVREPQPRYAHARLQVVLAWHLHEHIRRNGLDLVCVGPLGCVVERGPDTVRGPDLAVLQRGATDPPPGFVEGAPAIAVEILSPSNRRREILSKVREYLAAGAVLVWLVDDRTRTVTVHDTGGERLLSGADRLDAGELMPDFPLTVQELFAEL